MLGSCNLLAFILTGDPAAAKKFYGETLGLKYTGEDPHAMVFDANGIMVRITHIPGHKPTEHPILGWIVPDIRATAEEMVKAGIAFETYSFVEQDELGIWTAPDGKVKVAWFKDPDGNVLSISEI